MKKRIITIILLLLLLALIAGCGISKNEAMNLAEARVEQEFKDLSKDIVSYEVRATEATKFLGGWDIIVNVSIVERIAGTEMFTTVDGYYLVKVDKKGDVVSSELKKIGEFMP